MARPEARLEVVGVTSRVSWRAEPPEEEEGPQGGGVRGLPGGAEHH